MSGLQRIYPEEELHNLLIRRVLHTTPQVKKSDQREKIFQTKCKIGNKLCDLIIDGGSESNCISKELFKSLGLITKPYPQPYKLRWLDESIGNKVMKQCLVTFSIGTYTDQVPWQHDRHTLHNGYTNVYSLKHEEKNELIPLPPHRAIPPTKTKPPINLIRRKKCLKDLRTREVTLILCTKEVATEENPIPQRVQPLI